MKRSNNSKFAAWLFSYKTGVIFSLVIILLLVLLVVSNLFFPYTMAQEIFTLILLGLLALFIVFVTSVE